MLSYVLCVFVKLIYLKVNFTAHNRLQLSILIYIYTFFVVF